MINKPIFFGIVMVMGISLRAQIPSQSIPSGLMSNDSRLKIGILPNGFRFYIKHSNLEPGKVRLNFLIKAGKLQEDSNQFENAHILEHVAFRGSANLPDGIHGFTDGLGIIRGGGVNANTAASYTGYFFNIPSNIKTLKSGIDVFRDLASNLLIRKVDVASEKAAVIGESMARNGALLPTLKMFSHLFSNTRYGKLYEDPLLNLKKPMPIDTLHANISRFYKEWYRPDLEGLIVVGDIDPNIVEEYIINSFSSLKAPNIQRERLEYPAFIPRENKLFLVSDDTKKNISIHVYRKLVPLDLKTVQGFKKLVISKLYNEAIKSYFDKIGNIYNTSILMAGHMFDQKGFGNNSGVSTAETVIIVDSTKKLQPAVKQVFSFLNSVKLYGFRNIDLEKAKKALVNQTDHVSTNADIAEKCIEHFLHDLPIVPVSQQDSLNRELINQISLNDLNDFAAELINDTDREIVIRLPESEKNFIPDLNTVESWIETNEPFDGRQTVESVQKFKPVLIEDSGKILSEHINDVISMKKVVLSNGVTVFLKKIPDGTGAVVINGVTKLGSQALKNANTSEGKYAASLVLHSGVANLDKYQLEQYLADKGIKVSPYINDYNSGIVGFISPGNTDENLDLFVQLIQQYMIAPRESNEAFIDWQATQKRLSNSYFPEFTISNAVKTFLGGQDEYINPTFIDKMSGPVIFETYKKIFGDLSSFTFIVTGDFDEQSILQHIRKYLGSLPAGKNNYLTNIKGTKIPKSTKKVLYAEIEFPQVMLRYVRKIEPSLYNRLYIEVVQSLLHAKLTDRLRVKEKGVYSINDGGGIYFNPDPTFIYSVNFPTTVEDLEKHLFATKDEIRRFKETKIDFKTIAIAADVVKRRLESKFNRSEYWNEYFKETILSGSNMNDILNYKKIFKQMTPATIKAFANKYFKDNASMEFIGMPDESTGLSDKNKMESTN